MRLWCFFRIFTRPVYARMLQCTSSSISPWKSTKCLECIITCGGRSECGKQGSQRRTS